MTTLSALPRGMLGTSALVFALCATLTIMLCASMGSMHGMAMPGGWTLSMTWMRMHEQTWLDVAASFLGMWIVMSIAMMLPSLLPMLARYRASAARPAGRSLDRLTFVVAVAYFTVWTVAGAIVFAIGMAFAAAAMRSPLLSQSAPVAAGFVVIAAGLLQFSAWKARQLACCRGMCMHPAAPTTGARAAWRHGLRLGLQCCYCCAGLTAVLVVVGVMDLVAMGLLTAAITVERLAPRGRQVAQIGGALLVAFGASMILGAIGLA